MNRIKIAVPNNYLGALTQDRFMPKHGERNGIE